jgi:predicted nuclease of predicted toxin-antitoxin system
VIAKTLKEIGLRDAEDPVLFDAARRFGNIVIMTKDDDFVELVERQGAPPQIVWLTVGNATKLELEGILQVAFPRALEQLEAGAPIVEISR